MRRATCLKHNRLAPGITESDAETGENRTTIQKARFSINLDLYVKPRFSNVLKRRREFLYSVVKWLPGLGSNLGALLITNDLSPVNGCFNADCLTNSMLGRRRQIREWKVPIQLRAEQRA
jgi:hypothetical protein